MKISYTDIECILPLYVSKKMISGAGTAYPSGAHEIIPVFNGILIIP
jgi:hypothetical protein